MEIENFNLKIYKEFSSVFTDVLSSIIDKSFVSQEEEDSNVFNLLKAELTKKGISISKKVYNQINSKIEQVGNLNCSMSWGSYQACFKGTPVYDHLDQYLIYATPVNGTKKIPFYFQKDLLNKLIKFYEH